MSRGGVNVKVAGVKELMRKLKRFPPKAQRGVIRKSINAGSQVVVSAARKLAPRGKSLKPDGTPRKPLRKALTKKVRTYKHVGGGANIVAVVGPQARVAPHGHLVHGGTKPHLIPTTGRGVDIPGIGFVRGVIHHPGTKPNPFLKRALERNTSAILNKTRLKLKQGFEKLAKTA